VRLADQHQRDVNAGQSDMFGVVDETPATQARVAAPAPWSEEQRLSFEKETLGLYLTGHPITRYLDELAQFTTGRLGALGETAGAEAGQGYGRRERDAVVAGLVVNVRSRSGQSGRQAFVTLDDQSGRIEVAVFSDAYQQFGHLIVKDRVLVVSGGLAPDEFTGGMRMRAREVYDIDEARARFAKRLDIRIGSGRAVNGFLSELRETLSPFRAGRCPVFVRYENAEAQAAFRLGEDWSVQPSDELVHRLRSLVGERNVRVGYT
jgi:DNA polymerase-3 subunit alpha